MEPRHVCFECPAVHHQTQYSFTGCGSDVDNTVFYQGGKLYADINNTHMGYQLCNFCFHKIQSMTDLFGQTWSGSSNWGNGDIQSDWKNAPGMIRFLGPDGPSTWEMVGQGKSMKISKNASLIQLPESGNHADYD